MGAVVVRKCPEGPVQLVDLPLDVATLVLQLAVEDADLFGHGVVESLLEPFLVSRQVLVADRFQFRQIAGQRLDVGVQVVPLVGTASDEGCHRRRQLLADRFDRIAQASGFGTVALFEGLLAIEHVVERHRGIADRFGDRVPHRSRAFVTTVSPHRVQSRTLRLDQTFAADDLLSQRPDALLNFVAFRFEGLDLSEAMFQARLQDLHPLVVFSQAPLFGPERIDDGLMGRGVDLFKSGDLAAAVDRVQLGRRPFAGGVDTPDRGTERRDLFVQFGDTGLQVPPLFAVVPPQHETAGVGRVRPIVLLVTGVPGLDVAVAGDGQPR